MSPCRHGFEMNEYDTCIFNKMINGTQFTIKFHVGDLKLSHLQQEELYKIIDHLNGVFCNNGELLAASYRKYMSIWK